MTSEDPKPRRNHPRDAMNQVRHIVACQPASGNGAAGHAAVSGDNDRGTWSAGNGKLYVIWQNGSLSEWAYTVSGQSGARKLLLKGDHQPKPDEWMEQVP